MEYPNISRVGLLQSTENQEDPTVITLSSDSEEEVDVVGGIENSMEGELPEPPPPSSSDVPVPTESTREISASDLKPESPASPGIKITSITSFASSSGFQSEAAATSPSSLNLPQYSMKDIVSYIDKRLKQAKEIIKKKDEELTSASAEIVALKEQLELEQRIIKQIEESNKAKDASLVKAAEEIVRLKDALDLEENKNKEKDESEKINATRLAEAAEEISGLKDSLEQEQNKNKEKDIDILNLRDALAGEEGQHKVNAARLYDEIKKLKLSAIDTQDKLSAEESLRKSMELEKNAKLNEAADANRKLKVDLEEAKSQANIAETNAASMIGDARAELTQLWTRVSRILKHIDVEDGEDEANSEEGPVPFTVLLQTVENLKQQWDENMSEAREYTKVVKEELKNTTDVLMELVAMLNEMGLLGMGTTTEDDCAMSQ